MSVNISHIPAVSVTKSGQTPFSEPCPLCGRPLVPGPLTTDHHLIPRSEGGKDTISLHRICHQAIHAMISERELAITYHSIDRLQAHPDLARFIHWVKKRPPEFDDRTRWTRQRRQK